MKMADHSSATPPYSSAVSAWLASEKYAKVIEPGGADPHREDRGAPAVAATRGGRLRHRLVDSD